MYCIASVYVCVDLHNDRDLQVFASSGRSFLFFKCFAFNGLFVYSPNFLIKSYALGYIITDPF